MPATGEPKTSEAPVSTRNGKPRSPKAPISRLALSPTEVAEALGVSLDFYVEHIAYELRVVRRGSKRLVAVAEVERWLRESASRALEGETHR